MRWLDWLDVALRPHPLTHRAEEVEREVNTDLAAALESRLKTRLDRGIDLRSGARANAIRVAAEGNRLVIDEGDDHGVAGEAPAPSPAKRAGIAELFHTSMLAPEVLDDGRVAMRVVDGDALFGSDEWRDEVVDHSAREVVEEQLVDTVERAVKKVALEHPTDGAG